ncbi:hypothetical protein ACFPES_12570 [Paenibacillus sp. GCM10023248]|uniref:hypothetical protein n=1 Tax=unclassified Paenibacillus TaxID=185978 RepID=UPI00237A08F4|nr:hypothetical protein [Paenibacillus sp. MAHUQ-63]MDD9267862.1 hypothetical protein [Paenibacillus sp. MAHUQ-63]
MITLHKSVIEAFKVLGGIRSISEIEQWINKKYGEIWAGIGTTMADMVPNHLRGNTSSQMPEEYSVLVRVGRGQYKLIEGREGYDTKSLSI